MPANLNSRYCDLVKSLITLLELRNPYNIDHCNLVARYCRLIAEKAGLDELIRDRVERAAEVHTLGVSLQIEEKKPTQSLPITRLGLKDGRDEPTHLREERILRTAFAGVQELEDTIDVIIQRYEWFDGSYSLYGLKGDDILVEARLLAVADGFVDLATPKKHRPQESTQEVLRRLYQQSGTQFDPRFVEALAEVLKEEEGSWKDAGRVDHYETARCRHYLNLGHLYNAIHESQWALRSYLKAEKIAVAMQNRGLELGAISGQVMSYCNRGELERAREALQRARTRSQSEREKRGYHMMWGLVEWLSGRPENGQEILDKVIKTHLEDENVPGEVAALGLQANMLLLHRGDQDESYRKALSRFLKLAADNDLFDVVERYRPFTLPLCLSGMILEVEPKTARSYLTRMGEPCHEALRQKLDGIPPEKWTSELQPEPVIPTPEPVTRQPASADQKTLLISMLGGFRMALGETVISEDDWPTQKSLRLFAHLALANVPLSDTYLMETFWPDSTQEKARNSLRNGIHQIRSVLKTLLDKPASQALVRSRKAGTVAIAIEYELDTDRFEEELREAQDELEAGNSEAGLAKAKSALAMYSGDLLTGIYEDWVDGRRVQLKESYLRGLGLLARGYLEEGNPEAAEVACRKILADDDLREDAHALLIEAVNDDGRPAEAIRLYEEAVELFEREIGIAPASLNRTLQDIGLLLA